MTEPPAAPTLFDRLIAPRALFVGIACSFLGCCLAGWWAGRHNCFEHFERFHIYISPETLFYPTVHQVRELARSRLDPDKIVVIVGGSSVLHGMGQSQAQLWTRKLQALLGDRYQVLNLALRGALPPEFGAVAAEVLARDYPRLLLVSDLLPIGMRSEPDGHGYKYFFWDAHSRGLLLPDAEREDRLRELAAGARGPAPAGKWVGSFPEPLAQDELERGSWLNSLCSFNDLWNTLAYTHLATVWTAPTRAGFTRPRRGYPDLEPAAPPLEQRYPASTNAWAMKAVRDAMGPLCVRDRRGRWVADEASGFWDGWERAVRVCFPGPARKRTLLLVESYSTYYLDQLTPGERACHDAGARLAVRRLRRLGFAAAEIEKGYSAADYADVVHLAESGGAKLAAQVAPEIERLARRLGYSK